VIWTDVFLCISMIGGMLTIMIKVCLLSCSDRLAYKSVLNWAILSFIKIGTLYDTVRYDTVGPTV